MTPQITISDFGDVTVPPLDLPRGMISPSERRFLYDLARNRHHGQGALVEIGTWLGCSTMHLAAGLRDAGRGDRVHSYDDYVWRRGMATKSDQGLAEGDSFFPRFLANVASLADHIHPSRASAADLGWPGGAIETLVVDAPKSWRGVRGVFKQLAPHFIPGVTRIAFQDYLHFPSYEIALYLGSVDSLEPAAVVLNGSTVMFTLARPVDPAQTAGGFSYAGLSADQVNALWQRILAPLPPPARALMAPAHPMTLWQLGHHAAAESLLAQTDIPPDVAAFVLRKTGGKDEAHFAWLRQAILSRQPVKG